MSLFLFLLNLNTISIPETEEVSLLMSLGND